MSLGPRTKTEHAGAKNGGGYYGPRADAKRVSRKLRRQRARREAREARLLAGTGRIRDVESFFAASFVMCADRQEERTKDQCPRSK